MSDQANQRQEHVMGKFVPFTKKTAKTAKAAKGAKKGPKTMKGKGSKKPC